jgi:hypothetical protein
VRVRAPEAGAPALFELRTERKEADGEWSYGLYTPDGPRLRLNEAEDGREQRELRARTERGQWVGVSIRRINLNSCRACHAMFTKGLGPCGFTPANSAIRGEWAARYLRERGEAPFKQL